MNIHEIIRQRRLAKGLTQEQIAAALGVTAPAVNKWEKGVSYPDILLLPALARLLDTDLNTLLSFQDNLTREEVTLFLNRVTQTMEEQGFEAGYAMAVQKLREFPNCQMLAGALAMVLEGGLTFYGADSRLREQYQPIIEEMYRQGIQSEDAATRDQSRVCLISRRMEQRDFQQAQALLDAMPEQSPVDKKQIQANLFMAQGRPEQAARLIEEKLLLTSNELHAALMTLMEIAVKEGRMEDARTLAEADRQTAQVLGLMEYNRYVAHYQLYVATQDRDKCLEVLLPMLNALEKPLRPEPSPLYRHLPTKQPEPDLGQKFQKVILQSILTEEDTAFLRDSPELQKWMQRLG